MTKRKRKRYHRKKKRKTTTIYEIRAGKYFYIGKANNPWSRLEIHKQKAIDNIGPNKRKNRIFKQYLSKLRLKVIERPKMANWRSREMHHIARYRKKYGYNRVLNASPGGDGASGGGHDDKGRKRAKSDDFRVLAIFFPVFLCILAILCNS